MKNAVMLGLIFMLTIGMVAIVDSSAPIIVIDDLGRTVTIASSERIISIGPACTEILYAIGLGGRLIAVDKYSDYPPEAVGKQRISVACMPDPEEITALNPDLIVYYHWGPWDPTVETLSSLGLTVIAIAPKSLDDVLRDIRLIGNATSKSQEAEFLASALSEKINEIKSKTGDVAMRPRVYIEYWYPPPWTFGPNTWGHQLIELAGGINAFGDSAAEWIETTDEEVIARNPDVIISLYGAMHYETLETIKSRLGWDSISAVANGAVYLLDENLFVRPGPRLVDGLETLAKILHPELFGEANVFTFPLDTTILKSGVQAFNISGLMRVDIVIVKAAGNGTLAVTILELGPEAPANQKLIGNYLDIDCSIPTGLAFILRIHYSENQLRTLGVNEDSLKIFVWNNNRQQWMAMNSAVNYEENCVEVTVTHLSYFALMGEPTSPFWEYLVPLWLFLTSLILVAAIAITGVYIVRKKGKRVG